MSASGGSRPDRESCLAALRDDFRTGGTDAYALEGYIYTSVSRQ